MPTSSPLLPGTAGQTYVPFVGNNGGSLYPSGPTLDGRGLTLGGGMTAGWGTQGETRNPPLASTTGAAINPFGGNPNFPISRVGVLRNMAGSLGPSGKQYSLYFLYNPGQIGVTFQIDQTSQPPNFQFAGSNVDPTIAAGLTQGQSVGWKLIFDRTYDMMYDPDPNGNRGVLKDVGALYLLMGTFMSQSAIPMSTLCEVIFGQTDNGDIFGFTGYITAADITYPIFRHNMIPSRAEINITMTAVYVAPTTPTNGTGSGSATTVTAANGGGSGSNSAQRWDGVTGPKPVTLPVPGFPTLP